MDKATAVVRTLRQITGVILAILMLAALLRSCFP